jgi:predicted metal-dependent hydrolase
VRTEELQHGIRLFNEAKFFEAHEALEDVWRGAPPAEKKFFQGLVQVAVAFHHYSTGNVVGMRSVMHRAARNLAPAPANFAGIDLKRLLDSLRGWETAMEQDLPFPPPPRMERIFDTPGHIQKA